jgi:hypothetical protein
MRLKEWLWAPRRASQKKGRKKGGLGKVPEPVKGRPKTELDVPE